MGLGLPMTLHFPSRIQTILIQNLSISWNDLR
jgi:hypothetical protein